MSLSKPMGTRLLLFLQLPTPPFTSLPLVNLNKSFNTPTNNIVRCNSTGPQKTAGGQSRFDSRNLGDDVDDGDEFQFSNTSQQRIWWSDFDDFDDVWDVDEDDEFWVFKVFTAFGWMPPAILISLLLGTGPNAFIMALAVPLGQTALSLVFNKVSGRESKRWRSTARPTTKKKPFARSANNVRTNQGKQEAKRNGEERANYSSWLNMDGDLHDNGAKKALKFGEWDQLDDQVKTEKTATSEKGNGLPKLQKKVKFSRIGRVRETPLLLRLLIAIFPFLGSWTRFLF